MSTLESDVLLARGGDEAAFGRIVQKSANTVCSIALAISRNVQASEDIAQETFVAAWQNLRNLRNPESFLPWLRQVTRNQAHLWRREHARDVSDEALLQATSDARPTPIDRVLADEEQQLLRDAIDALPEDARDVLILYYREEQSTQQVALLLGMSEAAVRQRLSRARAAVREQVLEKLGRTIARTAPGAAFAAAVAGALVITAPTASAAVATSAGAKAALGAKGALAGASIAGALLGWFGVFMGSKYLEPAFDDREAHELRTFHRIVFAVVALGCALIALASRSKMVWMALAIQANYIAVALLYALRLPRILDRRMKWEQSVNPEMAALKKRQWMWRTISQAVAAAIGGSMLMAMLFMALK